MELLMLLPLYIIDRPAAFKTFVIDKWASQVHSLPLHNKNTQF